MSDGQPVEGSLYFYAPNKPAAIFFAVAFFISGAAHLWQTINYKAWRVTGYFPFCAALFAAGFALRAYGAFDYDNMPIYLTSTILIYASPPILELANYHILGRIMYYVPYCAPLHPGRVLTTFGTLSFLVEVLNGVGIAWLARPGADPTIHKVGDALTKASLILQVGVISLFVVLAALFQRRCAREGVGSRPEILKPLVTLYVSMGLISARTIYRIVEHFGTSVLHKAVSDGVDLADLSPIIRYEWFFYVFEATLMVINTYMWNVFHPIMSLPRDYHVYLSRKGHTQIKGRGWEDDRPFLVTWMDPLGLFLKGDESKKPFWDVDEPDEAKNLTSRSEAV
ncbi:related to Rtm1p [Cephalotrichum gorgonifer]|uniref:Related to Rtm1p n=1 Tax=Cephalotrichum gorgonifer TaxID=2041049 RepID=A0AAE8N7B3_9PEZI|nr:related to Rtm1p [Cephalotrichum gorgonifer]